MKEQIKNILKSFNIELRKVYQDEIRQRDSIKEAQNLYQKYRNYTMIPEREFIDNIELCRNHSHIEGAVVECGVWRGGMIAAVAEVVGNNRSYYLFDSFEGLPEVKEIDGEAAKAWQNNKNSPGYYDNCKAEEMYARQAMQLAKAEQFVTVKGWFSETLPKNNIAGKIAILRLDGDWYESTMDCLENLYDKVITGGIIIIDDYYMWDGCARAVHDFLSKRKSSERIYTSKNGVCYLLKK
ncbi:hypothetical protein GXP67_29750 [Rhodocytophaga rosea]|uniref:Macrocin O-methyltransferase n=1 Tax=Rhodocytophaga rosea TaxID=2704465 RepID=A0A6C0GR46_9BACT|nr:TylF/MycF/NovP-related O-methyltransferase [Rhodocytophaga rosea]QHT70538.1 hypothetical protein GXP67_29750 [Rhodocytophaga rosea]